MSLDFSGLDARLFPHAQSFLSEWLPAGRVIGHEFCVGDIHGSQGESLKFNLVSGAFADFADLTVSGNGLIAFYAAVHSCSMGDAFRRLSNGSGVESLPVKPASKAKPVSKLPAIVPLPDGLTAPEMVSIRTADAKMWMQISPSFVWWYRDGIVCRAESPAGKQIIPMVWTAKGWRQGAMPEPRPLYGVSALEADDDCNRPVLVVEGEKAADAAENLCSQYNVVTWAGGASAWRKTDWSPLAGRKVLLWPDADEPGIKAMNGIGPHLLEIGALEVKLIEAVRGTDSSADYLPDGWDAADAVAEGWTWETFKQWAKPRISLFNKGEDHGSTTRSNGAKTGIGNGMESNSSAVPVRRDPVQGNGQGTAAEAADLAAAVQRRPPTRNSPVGSQPAVALGSAASQLRSEGEAAAASVGNAAPGSSGHPPGPDSYERGMGERLRDRGAEDGQSGVGLEAVPDLAGLTHIEIWQALKLDFTQSGPIPNLDNVLRCLSGDLYFHGKIWFDEFLQRILTDSPPREWTDTDDTIIQARLQRVIGIKKVSRETVTHAVILAAHQNRRNVVKEYLRSVEWDRIDRCAGFFSRVFGAPDAEYTRAASRNFWVSMVARAERPGCKVDNMIILEGGQGMGKSTVANIIGGDWFAEQHESATEPVKFALILAGKLLVEISEMDAFSRSEVNRVKQVVSCRSDRYRVPYARHAQDHDRQGIFIGTTNKDDWNRDETGARRFWPIRCEGRADLQYAAKYRDQLFAEALYLFQQGIDWWEMPEVETRAQQSDRYTEDAWQSFIDAHLGGRDSTMVATILTDVLKIEVNKIGRVDRDRVTACLVHRGWKRGTTERTPDGFVKRWYRPGTPQHAKQVQKELELSAINRQFDDSYDTEAQNSE